MATLGKLDQHALWSTANSTLQDNIILESSLDDVVIFQGICEPPSSPFAMLFYASFNIVGRADPNYLPAFVPRYANSNCALLQEEYEYARVFPIIIRTEDELLEPFRENSLGSFSSLQLLKMNSYHIPDPFYSKWMEQGGVNSKEKYFMSLVLLV